LLAPGRHSAARDFSDEYRKDENMNSNSLRGLLVVGFAFLAGCAGSPSDGTQGGNAALSADGTASPAATAAGAAPRADSLPKTGGDSAWLMCRSSRVAVNVFEHRAQNGMDRSTDYVLLFGGFVLTGTVVNDAEAVSLNGPGASFTGTLSIDFTTNKSAKLGGTLTLDGEAFSAAQDLACVEMGQ
jgi:hypothetical protein